MQFGKATAGVAYSWLDYELGKEFRPAGQRHGPDRQRLRQLSADAFAQRQPLRQLGYDDKTFQDKVDRLGVGHRPQESQAADGRPVRRPPRRLRRRRLQRLFAGRWAAGNLDILTPEALALDQLTAHTDGSFGKLAFNAGRLQNVAVLRCMPASTASWPRRTWMYRKKWSSAACTACVPIPKARPTATRATRHAGSAAAAAEVRRRCRPDAAGRLRRCRQRHHSTRIRGAPGDNRRTLSGAGVGLTWSRTRQLPGAHVLRPQARQRTGDLRTGQDGRFWVQLVKYF